MAEKVTGITDKPVTFTGPEAQALGALVRRLYEHNRELDFYKTAMGLAIIRNGLEVIHHEHEDGTVSFDLQPKPEPNEPTPITH